MHSKIKKNHPGYICTRFHANNWTAFITSAVAQWTNTRGLLLTSAVAQWTKYPWFTAYLICFHKLFKLFWRNEISKMMFPTTHFCQLFCPFCLQTTQIDNQDNKSVNRISSSDWRMSFVGIYLSVIKKLALTSFGSARQRLVSQLLRVLQLDIWAY
jgi:hypothetical protein